MGKLIKLSASAIKTYEGCPRKYYYSYINKPKIEKKIHQHLEMGNFVHKVLEMFHDDLIEDPNLEWPKLLSKKAKEHAGEFKMTKETKEKSKKMLSDYLVKLRDSEIPNVLVNEMSFSINLTDDVLIRGYIDRVDQLEREDGKKYELVDYKGLALDTKIPTPSGWSTMRELKVGDYVFGSNGEPTKVTVKSNIHNRPCYRLSFSDGTEVVCDNVHRWKISYKSNSGKSYTSVINAHELHERFRNKGSGSFAIENHAPLSLPVKELPCTVEGLVSKLAINPAKIPLVYLRSAYAQRLKVLQGLMGVYGTSADGECLFKSSSVELSKSFAELVRTFGVTATYLEKPDAAESHQVRFRSPESSEPSNNREVVNVQKVTSVPTQCISVDAYDSLYLCGEGSVTTHNTGKSKYLDEFQLLVYGIALEERDPDIERFKGSYLVLSEDCKKVSYNFTKTDIENTKKKILKVAQDIREDETWETKPQFLCKFCDFSEVCPDSKFKAPVPGKKEW